MAWPLRGTCWQLALNSCKRGSRPGRREAGAPPGTFLPGGRESGHAGAIARRALPAGPGGCRTAPGWGHLRNGTGVPHVQTPHHSQESQGGRRTPLTWRWEGCRGASPAAAARGDFRGASPTPCPTAGLPTASTVLEEGIPVPAHPRTRSRAGCLHVAPCHSQQLRGASCHTQHRSHRRPRGPRLSLRRSQPGCPHRGRWASGLTGASVSPHTTLQQDHGAGGEPGTHGAPSAAPRQGRATPAAAPPAPRWRGRPHHRAVGCAGARPLPSTRRHVRGWLWGGRSLSQPRRRHASRKTYFTAAAGSSCPSVPGPG